MGDIFGKSEIVASAIGILIKCNVFFKIKAKIYINLDFNYIIIVLMQNNEVLCFCT